MRRARPPHLAGAAPQAPPPQSPPELGPRTTVRNAVENTLVNLERTVDELSVPGLKTTVGSLFEVIKAADKTEILFELYIHLARLENAVITPLLHRQDLRALLRASLNRLISELDQMAQDSFPLMSQGNHDLAIADVNERLKESVDAFLLDSQASGTTIEQSARHAIECMGIHFLSKEVRALPYADASFDSISRDNAPVCFEGTRVAVLDDVLNWIVSDNHRIYILSGVAGVGKTTIAQTISTLVAKVRCLSASFFFSRDEDGRNSLRAFFPTLAFQLAQFSELFEAKIREALMRWPDAPRKTTREQLKKLIIDPLRGISIPHGQPILIALDALDECGVTEGSEILRMMVDVMPQLPSNFKLFITMRPEPQFLQILDAFPGRKQMVLHDIEEMIVQEDIRRYLHHQLSQQEVGKATHGLDWQIGAEDLETLVRAAGRLFIVASTAAKFIKDRVQCDPQLQLKILLGAGEQDGSDLSPHTTLDRLYTQILEAAVPSNHSSVNIVRRFQSVIGSVIVLQHPLPLTSLAKLLNEELSTCNAALLPLHSVIVFGGHNQPPRVYHPSFPDFITDHSRCKDDRFFIESPVHHARLAILCLDIMDRLLRRNMCDLPIPDRYMKNSEIPNLMAKIEEHIPAELEYACTYWVVHLTRAAFSDDLQMKLEKFALKRLLAWLEVLSLTRRLDLAYPALVDLQKISISNQAAPQLLAILNDAQQLLLRSYWIVEMSAMHIYYSALPFTPIGSTLFEIYEYEASESIEVMRGRGNSWNPALAVLIGHSDVVNSVVFSPDGARLASASDDKTARLWNGVTGTVVAELKGHSDFVRSIKFSPDGTRLASASWDKTVRLWDGVTGALVAKLEGHSDFVRYVTFSPDGSRLASASSDKTVRLWDVAARALVAELKGHSRPVISVVFSYDGARLASVSDSKTVELCDGVTGDAVEEIDGHSDWVNSVAFSPSGARLASSSFDKTVGLWNGVTGSMVKRLEGHSDWVSSVTFSPGGSRLASASDDKTVRLWDSTTGAMVAVLEGHSRPINSVVFSPDGIRLATTSWGKTVRLWNGFTGAIVAEMKGHSSAVNSVMFSTDGTRLATASWGRTVRLWDGATGAMVAVLEGHSGSIRSIVFSPDGGRLASASWDKTVRLWSGAARGLVGELEESSDFIRFVVFSANCARFVSSSNNRTMYLCDGITGAVIAVLEGRSWSVNSVVFTFDAMRFAAPSSNTVLLWDGITGDGVAVLEGPSNSVISVVFSPDGTRLAAASYEKTVRLWDGVTGAVVAVIEDLRSVYSVVFSPDGLHLASISDDGTVRLWNATTGASIAINKTISNARAFGPRMLPEVRLAILWDDSHIPSELPASVGPPIESVHFEFDQDARCSVLSRHGDILIENSSKICLCWFPRSLHLGEVTQIGSRLALASGDDRKFIFSIARLKLA